MRIAYWIVTALMARFLSAWVFPMIGLALVLGSYFLFHAVRANRLAAS